MSMALPQGKQKKSFEWRGLLERKRGKKTRTRYHQRTQHNARGTRAPRRKYVTLYRCIGQKITMATDTGNGRNDVGCSSLLGGGRKKKIAVKFLLGWSGCVSSGGVCGCEQTTCW